MAASVGPQAPLGGLKVFEGDLKCLDATWKGLSGALVP